MLLWIPCTIGNAQIPDANPASAVESRDQRSLEELERRLRERVKASEEEDANSRVRRERDTTNNREDASNVPGTNSDPSSRESTPKDGSVREASPTLESDAQALGKQLQLSDVIVSTYRAFPLLEIARLQSGVAAGQQLSAVGAYDVKLEYYSLNTPVSFYETYRNGIGVARQLWWGGYASAGYRIGRGEFEPWYKERETNEGGEFKLALVQPLLQGRAIDPARVELFQANLRRQAVGPEIQNQILLAGQDAARAFWLWVEVGNVLKVQERLLDIAIQRGVQLEEARAVGAESEVRVALNAQLIFGQELKRNETRQKFRDTAFKLSLFLRDEFGNPLLAPPEWLPKKFPAVTPITAGDFEAALRSALNSRPELALIELEQQSLRWDLSLARNQLLPNVDFTIQTTQDAGAGASTINDKGDLQVEAGIIGGVPIQRSKARGKIQSTDTKIMQMEQKRSWQRNKIEVELRTALNALDIAQRNVIAAREALKQANIVVDIFRLSLKQGQTDFLLLLQQEVKANDSEVKLLEVERDFFIALAAMQAALGLDPLDSASNFNVP